MAQQVAVQTNQTVEGLAAHVTDVRLLLWQRGYRKRVIKKVTKVKCKQQVRNIIMITMSQLIHVKLDSRLLCNTMGHPGWSKYTYYNTPGMHFRAIFTQKKPAITQQKITTSETIYTCAEDYL